MKPVSMEYPFGMMADRYDEPYELPFGRELEEAEKLGLGPMYGVVSEGDYAYAIGSEQLFILDASQPKYPKLCGTLAGLGSVRQIALSDGRAFITSREAGLFIVDVQDPAHPRLLSHYDTLEFATGIAVSENLAFVVCRHYGVEIIDVSDPVHPVFISSILTGEAQSVAIKGHYLYVGIWVGCELVVVDVNDPRQPIITATVPLDGYGDGVYVDGDYCYVATGHHSRKLANRLKYEHAAFVTADMLEEGYGGGHGLEIFDISVQADPVFVSRIKLPPMFHKSMDMWSVVKAGPYAYVSDSINGIFIIDAAEPSSPRFVAYKRMDCSGNARLRGGPPVQQICHPASGIAIFHDYIYVASAQDDLYCMAAQGLTFPQEKLPSSRFLIPPLGKEKRDGRADLNIAGQVHAVEAWHEVAAIAAGMDGIVLAELGTTIRRIGRIDTDGFALDVNRCGDLLYVAEGMGGLSIWRIDEAVLRPLGRFRTSGAPVRQVVVPPPGQYAILSVGKNNVVIVDVSDPENPRSVWGHALSGNLYSKQIAEGLLEDRYACAYSQSSGIHWYDLYGGAAPTFTGNHTGRRICPIVEGVALRQQDALVVHHGGYYLLQANETKPPYEKHQYTVPDAYLSGQPCIFNDLLAVFNRCTGSVQLINIANIEKPDHIGSFRVPGNPNRIKLSGDRLLIPSGHGGLHIRKVRG